MIAILKSAALEAAGEVVATRADGSAFDHITEVRDAQRGLLIRFGSALGLCRTQP